MNSTAKEGAVLKSSIRPGRRLLGIVLLAALITLGAYAQVPLGSVPISLQTLFVLLAGFVLGPVDSAVAVTLYLLAGLVGLPVFAGGTSGIDKLLGATGGFLLSFVPAAAIAGLATRKGDHPLSWHRGLSWGSLASLVPFALGVPWLKAALGIGWVRAFDAAFLPFLPGAVLKLVLSVAVYRFLERLGLVPSRPQS